MNTNISRFLILLALIPATGCLLNNDAARQGFQTISQLQLNQLVMHIEFYKLQHGRYPDTLTQLRSADPMAPINDALQIRTGNANSYYNYKKVDDKYTVFSSGMDGVPHTKDDLFPIVDIPDSSKIGLIRPK